MPKQESRICGFAGTCKNLTRDPSGRCHLHAGRPDPGAQQSSGPSLPTPALSRSGTPDGFEGRSRRVLVADARPGDYVVRENGFWSGDSRFDAESNEVLWEIVYDDGSSDFVPAYGAEDADEGPSSVHTVEMLERSDFYRDVNSHVKSMNTEAANVEAALARAGLPYERHDVYGFEVDGAYHTPLDALDRANGDTGKLTSESGAGEDVHNDDGPDERGWVRKDTLNLGSSRSTGSFDDDAVGPAYGTRYVRDRGDGTYTVADVEYYIEPSDGGLGVKGRTWVCECTDPDDPGSSEVRSDYEYDEFPDGVFRYRLADADAVASRLARQDERANLAVS